MSKSTLTAAILVGAFLLTACGSSPDPGPAASPTATPTVTEPEPTIEPEPEPTPTEEPSEEPLSPYERSVAEATAEPSPTAKVAPCAAVGDASTYPGNVQAQFCSDLKHSPAETRAERKRWLAFPASYYTAVRSAKCSDPHWSSGGYKRVSRHLGLSGADTWFPLVTGAFVWEC